MLDLYYTVIANVVFVCALQFVHSSVRFHQTESPECTSLNHEIADRMRKVY